MRLFGLREITSGVGILSQPKPAGWLWSRVAGDVLDLSCLGLALSSNRTRRGRAIMATAAVAGVTALDVFSSQQLTREKEGNEALEDRMLRIEKSITIRKSPEELYRFWRDFQNLPRFMQHLESVRVIDDKRSHWVASGPGGKRFEWNAEIVQDIPNELIAWRSSEADEVQNTGEVRFERAPGGRGTEIHVEIEYTPPAGVVGAAIAKLFGQDPEKQAQEDLRTFKRLIETGEVPTTKGQPSGHKKFMSSASNHEGRML